MDTDDVVDHGSDSDTNSDSSENELSDPRSMDIAVHQISRDVWIRIGSNKIRGRETWFHTNMWSSTSQILGCAEHETDEEAWDSLLIFHNLDTIEHLRRVVVIRPDN